MNNLATLATTLAHMDADYKKGLKGVSLEHVCSLARSTVNTSLPNLVKTAWAENNGTYLDFRMALKPLWCRDDHELKMSISVSTEDNSWYVAMVVDGKGGELESWGNANFNQAEVESFQFPIAEMVNRIHAQYDDKLRKELAKAEPELKKASEAASLLVPHVEAIKKICKEHGITLYADHGLDSSNCMYVIPQGIQCLADKVIDPIDLDIIPYLDFGARGFEPSTDFFYKVK